MPQRYVKINHELIPVTEDVYLAYNRPKEKERFMARRDGKCRQEDYRICSGDCATCPWQQEGHRMMSLHKVLGSECEKETPAMDSNLRQPVRHRGCLHDHLSAPAREHQHMDNFCH